jgi:hypothetical protein
MIYRLDKASNPGYTLESHHIHWIRWMLEQGVCAQCKWTKADYEKYAAENPEELLEEEEFLRLEFADMVEKGVSPLTFSDFFPDNYSELTDMEKINYLLSTACGCEFWFEEVEDVQS